MKEFDIVVFGASGFTGQFVVEEVANSLSSHDLYKSDNLKWAIAGRSKDKLERVLETTKSYTGIDVSNVPIILADVNDYDSLLNMARRTRLIITVVGPYRLYGENVVKACVEGEANYVDISGEPSFLEGMQLKYHEQAKAKKVYIVGATGYDSIPSDLGTSWTKKNFPGELSGVEILLTAKSQHSAKLHYGTWHSAIHGVANRNELAPLRRKLYKEVLPFVRRKPTYPLPQRSCITKFEDYTKGYCVTFPGCDRAVVERSEVHKFLDHNEKPIQCATYINLGGLVGVFGTFFVGSIFSIMAQVKPGRYLLEKFPRFFSFGYASHEGPPREHMASTSFAHYIIGYGWDNKLDDPEQEHNEPPKKKVVTKVSGPEPGYIATSSMLVHSGISLLKDRDDIPREGGVLSPGAAYVNTKLVDRLAKRGIKFEFIEVK